MDTEIVYGFDYMKQNTICSTVKVYSDDHVEVVDYTNVITDLPFGRWGNQAEVKDVEHFLETRCFPKTRANCYSILKAGDIPFYKPKLIIEKTYGIMSDDVYWLRPLGDSMTYERIRERFSLPC